MRNALVALSALFALAASPSAEAFSLYRITLDPISLEASEEICGNDKDDDLDGLTDESPCVRGDLDGGFDKISGTSGPGGTTYIPWDGWLLAFDDNDGTLSVYELYKEETDADGVITATFQRVISGIDTWGIAQSPEEITVGAADVDGDGDEEVLLGFADYYGGVVVSYDVSSRGEIAASAYSDYLFSSGNSNVVTDSLLDTANSTLLLDTGYTDYISTGVGYWKTLNADVFAKRNPSEGEWVYADLSRGYTYYYGY